MTNKKVLKFARTLKEDLDEDLKFEEDMVETLEAEIKMMEDLVENENISIRLKTQEKQEIEVIQERLGQAADNVSNQEELIRSGASGDDGLETELGLENTLVSELEEIRELSEEIESQEEFELEEENQDTRVLSAEQQQIARAREALKEFRDENELDKFSEMEASLEARVEQTGDYKLAQILSNIEREGKSVTNLVEKLDEYEQRLEELESQAEEKESQELEIDTEEAQELESEVQEVESLRSEIQSLESTLAEKDVPEEIREEAISKIETARSELQNIEENLQQAGELKSQEIEAEKGLTS